MKYIDYTTTIGLFRQSLAVEPDDRELLFFMTAEMLYALLEDWYGADPDRPLWQNARSFDFGKVIVVCSHDEMGFYINLGIGKKGLYLTIKKGRPGVHQFSVLWPYHSYSLAQIAAEGKIIFEELLALNNDLVVTGKISTANDLV